MGDVMKSIKHLVLALLLITSYGSAAEQPRWYSDVQVTQGERLFRQNWASCHGQNAEGQDAQSYHDLHQREPGLGLSISIKLFSERRRPHGSYNPILRQPTLDSKIRL